jgi:hypothetical protein
MSSASAAAGPAQGSAQRPKRKGFWNRRGDHLTADFRVVYAPRDATNPADLAAYPHPTEGYGNHLGEFLPYDPNRPELEDSLPRQGRPPRRSYNSVSCFVLGNGHVTDDDPQFIQYV